MIVSATFDSGNIVVDACADPADVRLRVRPDAGDQHLQWFHFRAAGVRGVPCTFHLLNAAHTSYPQAWPGTRVCRSTDLERWVRVPTRYEDGVLTFADTPPEDIAWYAYFAPYGLDRHQRLIADVQRSAPVDVLTLTSDGHALDRVRLGSGPRALWVLGRQHAGETMASWWMEGFLRRLIDPTDALSRHLLRSATVHVVPYMNPDGGVRGHLRCNAAGIDLNRAWAAPSWETSAEVQAVRDEMDRTGLDFCLDVHGDEELPYVFLAGGDGIPRWSERLARLDGAFRDAYERACPDVQRVHGYPTAAPGEADLRMCTAQLAERFDACCFTLEMPFKDNDDDPDPVHGWSPERSARLGAAAVDALAATAPSLR